MSGVSKELQSSNTDLKKNDESSDTSNETDESVNSRQSNTESVLNLSNRTQNNHKSNNASTSNICNPQNIHCEANSAKSKKSHAESILNQDENTLNTDFKKIDESRGTSNETVEIANSRQSNTESVLNPSNRTQNNHESNNASTSNICNPQNIHCEANSANSKKSHAESILNQDENTLNTYDPQNVHYEGDIAIYTDKTSSYQYQWDKVQEKWVPRRGVEYGFEDDTHTYTDTDGIKFFWDKEKNAWFPKLNDDFMAQYQMNYGFINNSVSKENEVKEEKKVEVKPEPKVPGIKRKPSEPTWFELDEQRNTKVYVSNLPTDTTEEEFIELMQKCGLIMRDPVTQKMKIKLYKEAGTDYLKGDALCTYIRVESVDLALQLLDNYVFKDKKIRVERAKFQMRGEYDPKLKPKTKKRKEKDKLKRIQEKLFDWRPEKVLGERAKHEKVVVVKNVFDSKVFDEDVGLILEYQQDLREECSKCGDVRKVILYDRHPEGIVQVNMKEPEQADEVVTLLNGRWFGKRKLSAEIWDGKTKFKIAETDSEISQRLNKWDKFLESGTDSKVEEKS